MEFSMSRPTSLDNFSSLPDETEEEVWQESSLCHREGLRALPVAVYTCDVMGRVNCFNRAAVRLWGLEPELNKDSWCESWKIRKFDRTPLAFDKCPMVKT